VILADRVLKSCIAACPPEVLPEQPPATPPASPPGGLNNTPSEPPATPPAEVNTNDSNTTEQPPAQPPATGPGSNKKEPSVSLPKIPGCGMPTGLLLFALLGIFFGTAFRGTSRNL
jgi:hypothetical protein